MKKSRKNYTPQEKVAILRKHLLEKEAVSDICDKLNLQPSVFHRWLKEFFENGAAAFEHVPNGSKKHEAKQERRIERHRHKCVCREPERLTILRNRRNDRNTGGKMAHNPAQLVLSNGEKAS